MPFKYDNLTAGDPLSSPCNGLTSSRVDIRGIGKTQRRTLPGRHFYVFSPHLYLSENLELQAALALQKLDQNAQQKCCPRYRYNMFS
jgi:hypothetical protein